MFSVCANVTRSLIILCFTAPAFLVFPCPKYSVNLIMFAYDFRPSLSAITSPWGSKRYPLGPTKVLSLF